MKVAQEGASPGRRPIVQERPRPAALRARICSLTLPPSFVDWLPGLVTVTVSGVTFQVNEQADVAVVDAGDGRRQG